MKLCRSAMIVLLLATIAAVAQDIKPDAVLAVMKKVADWQLANPSKHTTTDWTQGAGYAGMMALAGIADGPKYENAMLAMGKANEWQLGKRMYHADDHCVGQTYIELYLKYHDPQMIAPTQKRFDEIMAHPKDDNLDFTQKSKTDRWSWCDSLFMAPPTWARLAKATGEKKYLDFANRLWWMTSDYLYDKDEHLYFRDSTYFKKREANGKKVFWSRGNGWVMGGLVRMLQYLPADYPDRAKYVQQFQEIADKLVTCQQADGLWRSSLLDPASYPLKETSGSCFDCYALTWGINNRLLSEPQFETPVHKAWAALIECVAPDGKLTHVQPIGADPKKFDADSTEVYGVGAFLLAGSEIYKLAQRTKYSESLPVAHVEVTSDLDAARARETIEVKLKQAGPVVVHDAAGNELLSQVIDDTVIFQADFAPKETRKFTVTPGKSSLPEPKIRTFARFVPERLDDFAWESDRIAFRMYGPALQKQDGGKTGSGVDVWCKHVREPVINSMYKRKNYHNDDGRAADNYLTGPNRGCGGTAIWSDGKLWAARCYKTWKLVAEGPIRAVFELTYAPWDANGRQVSEVKRVSLDLGSNLNRFESRYDTGNQPITAAAGLVIHTEASILAHEDNWASLWEKFSEGDGPGFIPVGLVWSSVSGGQFEKAEGHALVLTNLKAGEPFVYYAGAGWSKGPDFPDAAIWNAYLKSFAARVNSPLRVIVKGE